MNICFDAIIIGGGLGGLSAGAILSRQGKKVLLLEQHYIPGGCATTFKRKEYIMEVGLHAMDGHLISQDSEKSVLRFLGVHRKVKFEPIPEFFRIRNNRFDFTFPHGTDQAREALINAYPGEEKGIRNFFRIILGVQDEISRIPKKTWKRAVILPMFPFLFPQTFRTYRQTVGKCLDKLIRDDDLKLILQGNLLYYHDDPYSMSMVFFAKAQSSYIHHGGYFIRGGSQMLSDALANVIREKGGTILLGKKAEKILVNDGKAVGVSFRDSFNKNLEIETVHANHIIHSGALPLVPDLLPDAEKAVISKKIKDLVPACSLLCIYMGFKSPVKDLPNKHYSTFIYGDGLKSMQDVVQNHYGEWENRSFVFVDYSQIESGLAPEGKSFGVICCADRISDWADMDEPSYKQKKEEVARILLNRLEKAFPGITSRIEYMEVATSRTIRRYTLNPFGAPYGLAQIPKQAGLGRPRYRSPVENLWFSGNWTFPGGGLTGAILSGFLCGLQVRKKLGETTTDSPKKEIIDLRIVKLLEQNQIARNTIELIFEKPAGFTFQPGQYAFVQLNQPRFTELDMPLRSLSIVSHPDENELKFIMRRSNSSFKKSCESMEPGDKVTIYGPEGDFTLRENGAGMVFLVSGIGITPVIPMLKELEKMEYSHPVILVFSFRSMDDAVCQQYLKSVNLPEYRYIPVVSGTQGRVNKDWVNRELNHPSKFGYYLVGARSFLDTMTGILEELRVPEEQILMDDFG